MANYGVSELLKIGLISGALALAACGGGEERQATYLERAEKYYEEENFDKTKIEVKNVLQINPNNSRARYMLGLLAEQDQDYRTAFGNFNTALENDPTNIEAINKVTGYHILSNDLTKGLERANEAIALEPTNADALANLSAIYVKQEKNDQAIEKAQQALVSDPGNVQAVAILTALYAQNDPDLALKIITDGIANQSKNEALKMMQIRVLMRQGKRDEVFEVYKELIESYPERLLYINQLVNLYLNDDRYAEDQRQDLAEKTLQDYIQQRPDEEVIKLWFVQFLTQNRSLDIGINKLEEYLAAEPDNFKFRNTLARLYAVSGNGDKARDLYVEVINADPIGAQAIESRLKLIAMALGERDVPEAQRLLAEIFELEPENVDALIIRSRFRLADNDITGAIADLRAVLKNSPESVAALALLGTAHERSGAADLALDNYQQLVQIESENLTGLLGMSRILISKNELEKATSLLERANTIDPQDPESTRLLTELYSREQRWDDALSKAAQLTEKDETLALGYYLQGRIHLRKKDFKSAIDVLSKSHEIEPRGVETLSALVSGYVALEQSDKAIAYVEKHNKQYPDQLASKETLAGLYARTGSYDKAVATLQEILQKDNNRISSYKALTRLYASKRDLDKVEQLYTDGLSKSPGNDALRLMLAELYQARGNYEEAVVEYESVLEKNPDSLMVKNNMAAILIDHFNTPENLARAAEMSAELAGTNNPAFLDTAGWVQYQLGNYPQALSLLGAAVDNGGKSAVYQYHLGMAYLKNNLQDQAREHLLLALADEKEQYPGRDEAQKALDSL